MRRARSRAVSGGAVSAFAPVAAVLVIGVLLLIRGESVLDAIAIVPPWAIAGATIAHLLTLALRTEAWRTVLRAAGGEKLDLRALHAANAGAFLAGTVQGHAAMPTRIALLRRFGGEDSPKAAQIALADAPILMFEVCSAALLAAVGSTAVGVIPAWAPWAMLGGAVAVLAALRLVYGRLRHRSFAAGLAVLARPDLRTRLAIVVAAFTGMALLRTWIVLVGFGLPSDPASVCLVLFTMGTVGLLPIGIGTGPAATVAALGTANFAAATAAGMVVSTATVLAVLIYAGACWPSAPASQVASTPRPRLHRLCRATSSGCRWLRRLTPPLCRNSISPPSAPRTLARSATAGGGLLQHLPMQCLGRWRTSPSGTQRAR